MECLVHCQVGPPGLRRVAWAAVSPGPPAARAPRRASDSESEVFPGSLGPRTQPAGPGRAAGPGPGITSCHGPAAHNLTVLIRR
eukprot:553359-Hanusia_phi.AAC.1